MQCEVITRCKGWRIKLKRSDLGENFNKNSAVCTICCCVYIHANYETYHLQSKPLNFKVPRSLDRKTAIVRFQANCNFSARGRAILRKASMATRTRSRGNNIDLRGKSSINKQTECDTQHCNQISSMGVLLLK